MLNFACHSFDIEEVIRCGLALSKTDYNILNFLIKNKKGLDSKEISKFLKIDLSTAQRSLKRLRERKLIRRQQINSTTGGYNLFYRSIQKEEISEILQKIVNIWSKKVKKELEDWTN
jgi:predicted transcriptional regulator